MYFSKFVTSRAKYRVFLVGEKIKICDFIDDFSLSPSQDLFVPSLKFLIGPVTIVKLLRRLTRIGNINSRKFFCLRCHVPLHFQAGEFSRVVSSVVDQNLFFFFFSLNIYRTTFTSSRIYLVADDSNEKLSHLFYFKRRFFRFKEKLVY